MPQKLGAVLAGTLFGAYLIYDTQKVVGGAARKVKYGIDDYIVAALTVYLDILHIFLTLLRLLGQKKERR